MGDDIFYIYASGTTGLPKAARFSHLKFVSTGVPSRLVGFGASGVMYCSLPLYHSAGGAVLQSGGTLALRRKFSARDARATSFQYIGEFCRYRVLHRQRPASGHLAGVPRPLPHPADRRVLRHDRGEGAARRLRAGRSAS